MVRFKKQLSHMEESPREADSHSAGQEITYIL
jgi:hypothetical protein